MADRKFVLFVCTGNTCRSPMAAALFRAAVADRDDFEVASAGVSAAAGGAMSRETEAILRARGVVPESFASQPVDADLLARATHVFAMTGRHLELLCTRYPEYEGKCYLTCEFVDLPGRGVGCDVPDPIGGGPEAYREVAATLDLAIPSLVAFIDQTAG